MSNSPNLASPSVVLPGVENVSEKSNCTSHGTGSAPESRSEVPSSNLGESDVFSHMACLRKAFLTQGFSERVTELLSCTPGDLTPMQYTIQPGLSGVAGVLKGTFIHFQHL